MSDGPIYYDITFIIVNIILFFLRLSSSCFHPIGIFPSKEQHISYTILYNYNKYRFFTPPAAPGRSSEASDASGDFSLRVCRPGVGVRPRYHVGPSRFVSPSASLATRLTSCGEVEFLFYFMAHNILLYYYVTHLTSLRLVTRSRTNTLLYTHTV